MSTSPVVNSIAVLVAFAASIAQPADPTGPTGSGRAPSAPVATGDWSDSLDGLRARLQVFVVETKDVGREVRVYLDLQNCSAIATPLSLFYSADEHCSTTWTLTDQKGVPIPKTPIGVRRPVMPPYWIVLPYDSTLQLRASNGSSVTGTKNGATLLLLPPSDFWSFPKGSQDDCLLSCSFEAKSPADSSGHSNTWQGTLTIPKVKDSIAYNRAIGFDRPCTSAPRSSFTSIDRDG